MNFTSYIFVFVLALTGIHTAQAQWGNNIACQQTARQMQRACKADIHDDLMVTLANCTNISDGADRISCQREAIMTRNEEAELCQAQREARFEACEILGENRYDPDPLTDPEIEFIDPDDIPELFPNNPYVILQAGHTFVLRAGEEDEETVIVQVTDETRAIQGVPCRVVIDAVVVAEEDEEDGGIDYIPVEITDDWFAQDSDNNVYYCGEISRNFEDGALVDLDGSFEAGKDFAKAGILIKAAPTIDEAHRQEFALGDAEDIVQYLNLAAIPEEENPAFPCAPEGCLQTLDFAPLEPESTEHKFYLPGIGFVLAIAFEDGEPSGEREELLCVGDSLEILQNPACEIEDVAELLDELCELSDPFCPPDKE